MIISKNHIILLLIVVGTTSCALTTGPTINNYVEIRSVDSKEEIIKKSANVTPTRDQLAWQKMELTAFLHFGINTFTNKEWGDGTENPQLFNPQELDAGQWVKTCKDAGMKLIILTAKHHDGFCLWPSKYTNHTVKSSPWKNGSGDVVGDLAKACKEQGIKLGIYLSPWDRNSALYGTEEYNDYFVNQLTELLTNYGEVAEVWFDGANGEGPNGKKQIYDWQRYYKTIRHLQPNAVIAIMGPDVRWVGTESGYGRDTEWSVVPANTQDEEEITTRSQQLAGTFRPKIDFMAKDLGSREILFGAKSLVWYPSEVDVSIRPGWFYHPDQDDKVKSVEKLLDIYYSSVGKNSLLLLNIPPDTRGLIHENDVSILKKWKENIDKTFEVNLAAKSKINLKKSQNGSDPKALIDNDYDTYWMANEEIPTIEFTLKGEKTFDRLLIQEQITVGQRVEKFKIEAKIDGQWKNLVEGTTIGYKRLVRFPEVIANELRLTILKSRDKPALAEFGIYSSTQENNLKLWYNEPANASEADDPNGWRDDPEWLKALPLGNGSLGLMVFGDVNRERIQLNEESMWSGSLDDNDNPEAYAEQDKIRQLLFEGKYKEATDLTNKTQICKGSGSGHGNGAEVPFGCFQTLGDLWIDNGKQTIYENYYRELDLGDAVVRVRYSQNGVNYQREIFTSNPDQVMVARYTADKPGQISFSCTMTRPERYRTYNKENQLIMLGVLADGKGGDGLQYIARLSAVNKKGKVSYRDSKLVVENADEVILFLSASTDYILSYPDYKGRDYESLTSQNIEKAVDKGFDILLNDHKKEYQQYLQRVSLDITPQDMLPIPTDERVKNFIKTKSDPHLVELIFQYGRYLLISSSRPGTLPANLQGIWANKIQTPWNGDYHTDVNVEMNYWLAEVTNLSELHMPLFDLIESFVEPGKKTAKIQYHHNGWVIHPITNVWGYTSPGEMARWGMHTGAGAWICSHIGEHYAFTGDKAFLERMYPLLKGSVEFYLDWLIEDPKTGKLVSGPAVSPENTFVAPDGSQSQISMGPAHDQQVIWQLFTDFIFASNELNIKDEFTYQVKEAKGRLKGPKIGSDGRLMEWAEEFPEQEPGHRHISHLFALHPGSQITMEQTPELALAAKKSLDYRIANGGGHTGWSAAWLVSQYARLYEAEKARESLNVVLSKSTSPNLFGQHPPFQMDANFGATAGIAEMLLQSHAGIIYLLPALPKAWPTGEVKGLLARGGYEVDIEWENGALKSANVISRLGQKVKIKYNDRFFDFDPSKGEAIKLNGKLDKI